jgi:hypothetical protein
MLHSRFAKEVLDYTRACEHLIGESMRRNDQYSEEELQMVKYYIDEVARLLRGRTKHDQAWEAPRVSEASL